MKYILLILLTLSLQANYYIDKYSAIQNGWSVSTICKNSILLELIEGKVGTTNVRYEQPVCTNRSSWDSSCKHQPITCTKDKK